MKRSAKPASANTLPSPTVATVRPTAPSSTWRRAISRHLWVLACGRRETPRRRAWLAIPVRLASSTSRSTTRHGVCRSAGSGGPGVIATLCLSPRPLGLTRQHRPEHVVRPRAQRRGRGGRHGPRLLRDEPVADPGGHAQNRLHLPRAETGRGQLGGHLVVTDPLGPHRRTGGLTHHRAGLRPAEVLRPVHGRDQPAGPLVG